MAALTNAELMQLWRSVVDDGYSQPFIDGKAAGVATNIESFEQLAEQLASASAAIENSFQEMYLLPWSGQTADPAAGGQVATVSLVLSRSTRFEKVVVLDAAHIFFEEVATDWGTNGAVDVVTGRKFIASVPFVFGPGEAGPFTMQAIAERIGFGLNLCEPDTIRQIAQPGVGMSNTGAAIVPGPAGHRLVVRPEPDVVIPEHVGQHVELTAGVNAGQIRRVVGYEGPQPTGSGAHGGVAVLAATGVFVVDVPTGDFAPGEEVFQKPGNAVTARGTFLKLVGDRMVVDRTSGDFVVGEQVRGALTGATANLLSVDQSPDLIAEAPGVPFGSPGASWRVLDYAADLGVVVSNPDWPSAGRAAMLDELGDERKIYRQPGEDDAHYRKRVAKVADKISPAAVRRICNRILARYGSNVCLREVGAAKLPGIFFDGNASDPDPRIAYAYDLDFDARPTDRFKLAFDYTDFRAFFLLGVPPIAFGDFGIAYDYGFCNAYDAAPYFAFADGFGLEAAVMAKTVWAAVESARAGGVGFDLYTESLGCF